MSQSDSTSVEIFQPGFSNDKQPKSVCGVPATSEATNIVSVVERALPVHLQDAVEDYSKASRADNTKRCYSTVWRQFEEFCETIGRQSLPTSPSTVQAWIVHLASEGYRPSTIANKLAGVATAHRAAGLAFDRRVMIGLALDGVKRTLGVARKRGKAASLSTLRAAVASLPDTIHGARDRALLLIGFFAALRRSEIVGLDVDRRLTEGATGWIEFASEGLIVHLARSKTDQNGAGEAVGIPRRADELCPATALQDWIAVSEISDGAIFRRVLKGGFICNRLSCQSVRLIVRKHLGKDYAPHGALRAGFITEAAKRGASEASIQLTSRHKSVQELRGYIRMANVFEGTAHSVMED